MTYMQKQMFLTVLLLYMPSNVDGVEHAGNAQIHTQKLCSEYFNQIFVSAMPGRCRSIRICRISDCVPYTRTVRAG